MEGYRYFILNKALSNLNLLKMGASENCYLCHSVDSSTRYAEVSSYLLCRCSRCSLVYTANVDPSKLHALYQAEDYYSAQGGSGFEVAGFQEKGLKDGLSNYYFQTRIFPIQNHLRRTERDHAPRYLDIGCSAGHALLLGKLIGWEVEGVEASPVAARFARESLHLKVHSGTLEDFSAGDSKYDVISFFHVLEHLADPRDSLRRVHRLLEDDGVLAIEVPNVRSLPARIRKGSWHGYVLPYHLWHFSFRSMKALLEQSGFEVVEWNTPFSPCSSSRILNLHRIAARVLNALRFRRTAPPPKAAIATGERRIRTSANEIGLRKLIHSMYWPTDQMMSRLKAGESLYLIARKTRETRTR